MVSGFCVDCGGKRRGEKRGGRRVDGRRLRGERKRGKRNGTGEVAGEVLQFPIGSVLLGLHSLLLCLPLSLSPPSPLSLLNRLAGVVPGL